MTKKELIELLSNYEDDTLILVDGYENGYDDIENITIGGVYPRLAHEWWEGKYSNADEDWQNYPELREEIDKMQELAIILQRPNKYGK